MTIKSDSILVDVHAMTLEVEKQEGTLVLKDFLTLLDDANPVNSRLPKQTAAWNELPSCREEDDHKFHGEAVLRT